MSAVESNIVGYEQVTTKGVQYPTVGVVFTPVNGDTSVKLGSLKMVSADDPINDFMDPEGECIQILTTDGAGQDPNNKFTYFSKEFVDAAYDDPTEHDEMLQYIGWWKYEFMNLHVGEEGMSRDDFDVDVGQAFLGDVSPAHTLYFTASGEVPAKPTYADSGSHQYPFICNYLHVDVALRNVTVTSEDDPINDFMDPEGECIQKLTTDGAGQDPESKFTYFSKEFVDAAYDDPTEHDEMLKYIGWWKFEFMNLHVGEDGMNRDAWVWDAGTGLLGDLSPAHTLHFNFPATLDVE